MTQEFDKLMSDMRYENWCKSIVNRLKRKFSKAYYAARSWIFPYNVIKISALDRTWHDRDYVMFHANFQILVDFIELEQPYISWGDKCRGRITNIVKMREFINDLYGPENRAAFYADWFTEEEKADQDRRTNESFLHNNNLLDLYEWYVTKKYEASEDDVDEYNQLDEKLLQLIKLRRYLWT